MLNAIKRYKEPHGDTPEYSWVWILSLTLIPGLLIVALKGLLIPLHSFGIEFVWIVFYS
jgi:hypothetical protein